MNRHALYLPNSKIHVVSEVDDTTFVLKTRANLNFEVDKPRDEFGWMLEDYYFHNDRSFQLRPRTISLEWQHLGDKPLYKMYRKPSD